MTWQLPERVALFVIDLQNDFAHPEGKGARDAGRSIAATQATIPVVQRLLAAARRRGDPVYFFRQTYDPDHTYPEAWLAVRQRVRFSAPQMCVKGTWGQAIVDELTPLPGEKVYDKLSYSGFAGTTLAAGPTGRRRGGHRFHRVLHQRVRGINPARGVLAGVLPIVPRDAVSSWSMELHEASLRTFAERFAWVCTAAEVEEAWRG